MRKSLRSAAVLTVVVAATTTGLAVQAGSAGASERTEAGAAACIGAVAQRLTDVVAATGADPELIDDVAFDQDFDGLEEALRDGDRATVRDVVREMIDDTTARTASELGRSDLSLVSDPDAYVRDCEDAADEAMDEFGHRAGAYYWYSNERPWRDFNRGWWRHWAPRYFYSGFDVRNGFPGREITCRGPLAALCIVNFDRDDWRFRDRYFWGSDFGRWERGRVGIFRNTIPMNVPTDLSVLANPFTATPGATVPGTSAPNTTVPGTTAPSGTTADSTTTPSETAPSGAVTTGTVPAGTTATDSAPAGTTTTDTAPAGTTTTDTAPAGTTTTDSAPAGTTTTDSAPESTTGTQTATTEAPADSTPATAAPADTAQADTAPADTAQADTAPADTAPADTAPADTAPADTAPADTAPAQSDGSSSAGSTADQIPTGTTAP